VYSVCACCGLPARAVIHQQSALLLNSLGLGWYLFLFHACAWLTCRHLESKPEEMTTPAGRQVGAVA